MPSVQDRRVCNARAFAKANMRPHAAGAARATRRSARQLHRRLQEGVLTLAMLKHAFPPTVNMPVLPMEIMLEHRAHAHFRTAVMPLVHRAACAHEANHIRVLRSMVNNMQNGVTVFWTEADAFAVAVADVPVFAMITDSGIYGNAVCGSAIGPHTSTAYPRATLHAHEAARTDPNYRIAKYDDRYLLTILATGYNFYLNGTHPNRVERLITQLRLPHPPASPES